MANEVQLRLIYHLYCPASMMTAPLQSYYDDTMHVVGHKILMASADVPLRCTLVR